MEIQRSPSELLSHTSAVYLRSNNRILQHFVIEWKAISKTAVAGNLTDESCKKQIITLANYSYVNISSPGFPDGYDNDLDCEWIIKTNDSATHVALMLRFVDLENVTDCAADYLAIYSSSDLVDWKLEKKECSVPRIHFNREFLIHGRPFLKLHFHTDISENRTGFEAYIIPACGGVMTEPNGIINGHTGSAIIYTNIMNCTWNIRVKPGRKIQFEFTEMKLPANPNGGCDGYVSIRDGIDEHSPYLGNGRFCEATAKSNLPLTTSHRAFVIFSFTQLDHLQWELSYKEIGEDCGDTIWLTKENKEINITTPNYPNIPQPHTECTWIINGPFDETLQLEFIDLFDLLPNEDCPEEYVEIRDGSTYLSPKIGRYCRKPNAILSTENSLYIKYVTDVSDPRNGFKAKISTTKCGKIYSYTSGQITSSNYPNLGAYPSNSICNYTITSQRLTRFSLILNDIHLPFLPQNLNESDHLTIFSIQNNNNDNSNVRKEQEILTIYGNNTIPNVDIEGDGIIIRFYSYKQNFNYRGFKISYSKHFGFCGGFLTKESGELTINRKSFLSSPYRYSTTCRWRIQAPKGRRVTVQINNIEKSSEVSDPK